MEILFISSYVPRKCGIATYTRDLVVEMQKQGHKVSIVALKDPIVPNTYKNPVIHTIRQNYLKDYLNVAKIINKSSIEVVHLQHEFGLFGGKDGRFILNFAQNLQKPLIVTFHTVLLTPSESQKAIIQELTRLSRKVIVMDRIAKKRLEDIYDLNQSDISIIIHGAPEIPKYDINKAKRKIGFSDNYLMLANNLLSRNKGIEYGIDAVSKTLKYIPNLKFLIVGETHPLVKASEGESYREELILQVKNLGLEKNVVFINEYVSLEKLKDLLAASDVYITPYLDPEQTSSGTLSYAIGAKKVCIATEYVYAKEMLALNKGIIVPFRDSDSISEALIDLYNHPEKRRQIEKNTADISKNMSWPKVSEKHTLVYKKITLQKNNFKNQVQKHIDSPLSISHLIHLTNESGILQHSNYTTPNLPFGYSTDDNARALIVVSQLFNIYHSDEMSRLITIYGSFLSLAQTQDGKFHTFLNSDLKWIDTEDITDAYGRAIWGLGFHLYSSKNHYTSNKLFSIFQKAICQVENIRDLRTASYTILGLYYFILAFKTDTKITDSVIKKLSLLAKLICDRYVDNNSSHWEWFEETATYDNFRVPQALFAAFLITGNLKYKEIGKLSLEFLERHNFDTKKGYFDFIGQDGWHKKNSHKAVYDQQPLEAAGAVEAFVFASKVLDDSCYFDKGLVAFEWFFGNNRNNRPIYDEKTKGVADGLTSRGTNTNQGAESIICFLMSHLTLKQSAAHFQKINTTPKIKLNEFSSQEFSGQIKTIQ